MSLTTKVLIALLAGLALGVLASVAGVPALRSAALAVEPVGTMFINAIRMTVIPLVMGSLVVGVASSPDPRRIGRIGVRALAFFLGTVMVGAAYAAVIGAPLIRRFPIDATIRAAMGAASTAKPPAAIPSFTQWLVDLVPVNPIKAAADGAMLPLIVFSLVFGLAIGRLTPERRDSLVALFDGVAQASLQLVRWVLETAPIGVFALTLPLAARMGATVVGAIGAYILVVVGLTVAFAVFVLYPIAAIGGRVPLGRFARAALPPQAVAISSRSSLAALPAMMESARSRLGLPDDVVSFLLPLAASTYRVGGAIGMVIGVVFLAHLYDVTLGATAMATIVLTVSLATLSVPGVPAGSILIMAPVLATAGIDAAGLGILIGVDTIPDTFRTATNVTADMAAATVIGRSEREGASANR